MIKDIKELNFPAYATISSATVTINDMGESTITAQVKIDGDVRPDFSYDWEVEFKGEKYVHHLRSPQATKENTSLSSVIDLTFKHWAIYELQRYYFVEMASVESGTPIVDKYFSSMSLNLENFVDAFNKVLDYYYGGRIVAELAEGNYDKEVSFVGISHSYIWDVLLKVYDIYGVRWYLDTDLDKCVVKLGYPAPSLDHVFEYGYDGGFLKVERQVQSDNIRNIILGRGGDKNIPYRYFKNVDKDNPSFPADPDWIPEFKDMFFSELRDAAFRAYVQGWKYKHYYNQLENSQYVTRQHIDESLQWAYDTGYNDEKFDPVEFVKDDVSIRKYGELWGGLENNQEIYPTIQGITRDFIGRVDEVVDVEQIESDDVEEAVVKEAIVETINTYGGTLGKKTELNVSPHERRTVSLSPVTISVLHGMTANVMNAENPAVSASKAGAFSEDYSSKVVVIPNSTRLKVVNTQTGEERAAAAIPQGVWRLYAEYSVENTSDDTSLDITVSLNGAQIEQTEISGNKEEWKNTFNIWVKNIWQTTKLPYETDDEYAERVWKPILGDHVGGEAKVVFRSGRLSDSSDYEFTIPDLKSIAKVVHHDTSKEYNGVKSEWRLTLAKSEADLNSLGVYVPNTMRQGKAGDYFFFTGIDLPYLYYTEAEKELTKYKEEKLASVSDILPSWVVTLDKVRIANKNYGEAYTILEQIKAGATVLATGKPYLSTADIQGDILYIQSITYTYNEPSKGSPNIIPDVEVVLADKPYITGNPVEQLQGNIDALSRRFDNLNSFDYLVNLVKMVGNKLYLRKDGFSDTSISPTAFASLLTSLGFRQGMIGGAGWGFYKDENGKWVMETDRVNVREDMQVNTLVINQIDVRGGMIVESAANMSVVQVTETDYGYVCYFNQKFGSVANLFKVDDVAYSHRFTPENNDLKYYKRRVLSVSEDSITIAKNGDVDGVGVPAEGDVIAQYGNYTDKERQYVIVRDVIGGGYERMIGGLDSVHAKGYEYFFAGYQSSTGERLFIGNKNGNNWLEYVDGKLTIAGRLTVLSEIQNNDGSYSPLNEYLDGIIQKIVTSNEDIKDFVEQIIGDKTEDLQNQIDGVIETWFQDGVPTLDNYPASEWKTENEREKHSGDLYYDNTTGTAYRFSKDAQGNWYWNVITDEAITKALAAAKAAQDTADGKRRVFVDTPKPPYDAGDLWVNATYGTKYSNDILRCSIGRQTGAFDIDDWGLASEYRELAQAAKDAADAAQRSADEAKKEAKDVLDEVNNFKDFVNGAFRDGIIDESEWAAIKAYINTIKQQKAEADAAYDALMKNSFLQDGQEKEALSIAKTTLDKATTGLINIIEQVISDKKITDDESNAVDDAFATFSNAYAQFTTALENASHSMQEYIKGFADKAQTAADNAQKAADEAKNRLNSWAEDGVISPVERQSLMDEVARIDSDKELINDGAELYDIQDTAEIKQFNEAHERYRQELVDLANPPQGVENVPIPATFAGIQEDYYNKRATALNAITGAAKTDYDTKIAGYEYLKNALGESTTTSGGLILTSLIQLGMTNKVTSTWEVWSGINGQPIAEESKGYGIAAWYGGDMIDAEKDGKSGRYAQSLFRFDGSGYLAGGNITWKKDGTVTLANVYTNVSGENVKLTDTLNELAQLQNALAITVEDSVTYLDPKYSFTNLSVMGKEVATKEWADDRFLTISFFDRLFQAYNGSTKVQPNSTDAIDSIKAMFGFWTERYISAMGKNDDAHGGGGGGSSYLSGLLDVSISNLETGQVLSYDGSAWVNKTVQQGFDAKQLETYLTSNGYATQSWVGTQGYLTITSAANTYLKKSGDTMIGDLIGSNFILSGTANATSFNATGAAGFRINTSHRVADTWAGYNATTDTFTIGLVDSKLQLRAGAMVDGALIATQDWVNAQGFLKSVAWANVTGKPTNFDTNVLKNYYTSRPASADVRFDDGGVRTFKATSSMMTGKPMNDGSILHFAWDNNGGYESQIYVPLNGASMQHRMMSAGTWGNWITLISTANYTTHLDGRYMQTSSANATFVTLNTDQSIRSKKTWNGNASGQQVSVGNTSVAIEMAGITFNYASIGATGVGGGTLDSNTPVLLSSKSSGTLSIGNDIIATRTWVEEQGFSKGGNLVTTDTTQTITANKSFSGGIGVNSIEVIGSSQDLTIGASASIYLNAEGDVRVNSQLVVEDEILSGYGLMQNTAGENLKIGRLEDSYTEFGGNIRNQDMDWEIDWYGNGTFNSVNQTSDIRLKDVTGEIKIAVEDIANAPSVSYKWKKTGLLGAGTIAQYWEHIAPELVSNEKNGSLSIQYGNLALLSAISIAKEVVSHEDRIKSLENENAELKRRIDELTLGGS